ncbi:MAG TPA: hypothetical protein VFD70_24115 [Anaerolineae bacterium]|nr:hypothetical protein [Anaerolineae bacterium]
MKISCGFRANDALSVKQTPAPSGASNTKPNSAATDVRKGGYIPLDKVLH